MLSLSLLARPFSRPSDLKSRSCARVKGSSALGQCAWLAYSSFSIIVGGFVRLSRRHFPAARRWPCFKCKIDLGVGLDSQLAPI